MKVMCLISCTTNFLRIKLEQSKLPFSKVELKQLDGMNGSLFTAIMLRKSYDGR